MLKQKEGIVEKFAKEYEHESYSQLLKSKAYGENILYNDANEFTGSPSFKKAITMHYDENHKNLYELLHKKFIAEV